MINLLYSEVLSVNLYKTIVTVSHILDWHKTNILIQHFVW